MSSFTLDPHTRKDYIHYLKTTGKNVITARYGSLEALDTMSDDQIDFLEQKVRDWETD